MRIYKRFFNTRILFPFLLQNRDKKAFCQNFPAVFLTALLIGKHEETDLLMKSVLPVILNRKKKRFCAKTALKTDWNEKTGIYA